MGVVKSIQNKNSAESEKDNSAHLLLEDLKKINTRAGLKKLFKHKNIQYHKVLEDISYDKQLKELQIELVKLQRDVQSKGRRVAILFEGRDAAGKGGQWTVHYAGAILLFRQNGTDGSECLTRNDKHKCLFYTNLYSSNIAD